LYEEAAFSGVKCPNCVFTQSKQFAWLGLLSTYRTIFEAPSLDLLLLLGQLREGNAAHGNGRK
ncbi:MAG: hypothetical protein R3D62_15465, partial [Xanthobacteraceae bacterium]